MLPAPKRDRISLADVMPSCLASLAGLDNRLGLPTVSGAVVVLADGLGAAALRARAGHARTLAPALNASTTIESGFPTTTAAAIARLTTGVAPGQNGMVGYSVYDSAGDRIVNQLTGWDAGLDPQTWQLAPTLFQAATAEGILAASIGPERYRDTGFTHAVLRGSKYIAGETIADRVERALDFLNDRGERKLIYLYVPELDKISHSKGWESAHWTAQLEAMDGAVGDLSNRLGSTHGLLVTADHGVVDVPHRSHILIDSSAELIEGIRFVAGEPRCLQLHFEKDASAALRDRVTEAWRASEGERSWVATRQEAIAAGWFGDVRPDVGPRIGDLLVAARKNVAYYDTRVSTHRSRAMIGQHGSWSPEELQVPLLRFGAFA
jgi:predicted AlkP superfamily pyrophosphatase or phosphodiesterase